MKNLLILLSAICIPLSLFAQNEPDEAVLNIEKSEVEVKIDGELNETVWLKADKAHDFYLSFPVDTAFANSPSEAMLTYDDDFLYIAFVCHDPQPGNYVVESLRRDWDFDATESINVYIDPFNDHLNGFTFGISPFGVQREGLIVNAEDISTDWDNKWFSAVKRYEDKWIAEVAIPFKTIRYNPDISTWNINFIRNDLKRNERSSWTRVPRQFRTNNLTYAGRLQWDAKPPKTGSNISVIPFVTGSVVRNFEAGEKAESRADAGFDAKVAVSSSLNLDITVNPDFSQVEVDRQVTNLDRFEIFFPERRQFFLENNDLFGERGTRSTRPFFSRRIGIDRDTASNTIQVPIRYGARLSGKLSRNWRIGLLNMQTAKAPEAAATAQNYSVGIIQRQLLKRSTLSAVMVNRQSIDFPSGDSTISHSKYNRVVGLDYDLQTVSNRWQGSAFYHRSIDPEKLDKNYALGSFLRYGSRNLTVWLFTQDVGENYNAEVGFVRRTGIKSATNNIRFSFYPTASSIVEHGPSYRISLTGDKDYNLTDRNLRLGYTVRFNNTSQLELNYNSTFQELRRDFNPVSPEGDTVLLEGTDYNWRNVQLRYNTDNRKLLSADFGFSRGSYYTGTRTNIEAELNYRYQPFGFLSLTFNYNRIKLADPLPDAEFFLVGPRIDFTFTDKLFLTTFVQYNNQADNVNLNTRFQWRFKPVSDLFLVYTDNYFPENFKVKSRAVVFKMSYWLNL